MAYPPHYLLPRLPRFHKRLCLCGIRISSLFFFLVFLFNLVCAQHSDAQGWQWARSGRPAHVDAWAVATDPAGNVYAAGEDLDLTPVPEIFGTIVDSVAPHQALWVKYDPSGTPLWSGFTTGDGCWLNNICTDNSGNLIVYGVMLYFSLKIGTHEVTDTPAWTIPYARKYFIAKIDPTGYVIWLISDGLNINYNNPFSLPDNPSIIGDGGVTTDHFGNIYVTGNYHDSLTLGGHTFYSAGQNDAFVAKYSPSGALLWANAVGGPGNDRGISVTVSSTGHTYICGYTDSATFTVGSSIITNPYSNPLAFIAEFSPSGTPLWAQAPGGRNGSFAVGLQSDNYGNVYMTGGFEDTSISFGTTTLSRTFPSDTPHLALFLVRYAPSRTVDWCKTIGSRHKGVWGYSIAMASCGQIWVSGSYSDTAIIDSATLLPAARPGVADPIFIAGYGLDGGVVGYSSLRTGGDDQNGIASDAYGNVYVCSDIETYIVAGPDSIVKEGIGENIFVAKYGNTIAAPDTVYQSNDSSICSSGTDSIRIAAPRGYTNYFWSDSTTDSFHVFHLAGTYWVYCISCGDPVLIDTFRLSDTIVNDTVTSRKNANICMLSDTPVPLALSAPVGGIHYSWSSGSTTQSDSIYLAGTYWVSYISHCKLHIDTFVVTAVPQPPPISGRDPLCVGDFVTLTDALPGGIWKTSNTAVATIDSSTGYTAGIAAGIDTIRYIMPNGCFAIRTETVLAPPCVNAVNQIHTAANAIELYPVPARNELVIKTKTIYYSTFTITNPLGQVLLTGDIKSIQTIADVSKLPSGFYYITFKNNYGNSVRKFVKE